MDFVERVFFAAVKRAPGAREQVGHTEADDDGHERGNELETAHQVLSVLHGDLLKAFFAHRLHIDRRGQGDQALVGANVRRGLLPADVLLTRR